MTLYLAATKRPPGLQNIGNGAARSWINLAKAVFAALKQKTEN